MAIASPTLFIRNGDSAERRKLGGDFEWRLSAESRYAGLWEFLEGKARNLDDDVINARLEVGSKEIAQTSKSR